MKIIIFNLEKTLRKKQQQLISTLESVLNQYHAHSCDHRWLSFSFIWKSYTKEALESTTNLEELYCAFVLFHDVRIK